MFPFFGIFGHPLVNIWFSSYSNTYFHLFGGLFSLRPQETSADASDARHQTDPTKLPRGLPGSGNAVSLCFPFFVLRKVFWMFLGCFRLWAAAGGKFNKPKMVV